MDQQLELGRNLQSVQTIPAHIIKQTKELRHGYIILVFLEKEKMLH